MDPSLGLTFDAQRLGKNPTAFRLYRAAEQQAISQKQRLSPDQWAQLVQALAAFGMALARIFMGQNLAAPESESAPDESGADGSQEHDQEHDQQQG